MKFEYLESAEASDTGRKRKNNEDACWQLPKQGIFCVADGMGGAAGGGLASEAITTSLKQAFSKVTTEQSASLGARVAVFIRAANQASKWIKNFADEKVIGQMGSTVVALVLDPRNPARAMGLHAGDSRLYRYRAGEIVLLTVDHSAAAALAAKLGCEPASIPAKFRNELVRAVGLDETVKLEQTPIEVAGGDLFLLCSDGLTKMVADKAIGTTLKRAECESVAGVAQALVDEANEAGGKDNVTVVLIKVGDISRVPVLPDIADEEATCFSPLEAACTPDKREETSEETPLPDTVHGVTPTTREFSAASATDTVSPTRPSALSDKGAMDTGESRPSREGCASRAPLSVTMWVMLLVITCLTAVVVLEIWSFHKGLEPPAVENETPGMAQ
ncbi:MAG: protein phosphatase 2C domain-containing protein [Verrucomicrobiota bacterium]